MNNEIEKSEQPDPDDILTAIQSFNDPALITGIFKELGWSYSLELRETVAMAKQNANLSIKFKAIKHLRELLREAAESSGYVANVSKTIPNDQGGQTTFSAKRIANILKPTKQIESTIKEPQNERAQQTNKPETGHHIIGDKSDRGCDREKGERLGTREEISDTNRRFPPEQDTGRAVTSGDAVSGGFESTDGGQASEQQPRPDDNNDKGGDKNPCIKTRPPTCDPKLFPGISISAEEG